MKWLRERLGLRDPWEEFNDPAPYVIGGLFIALVVLALIFGRWN